MLSAAGAEASAFLRAEDRERKRGVDKLANQVADVEHGALEHIALRERVLGFHFRAESLLDIQVHAATDIAEATIARSGIDQIDRTGNIESAIKTPNFQQDRRRLRKDMETEIRDGNRLFERQLATGP